MSKLFRTIGVGANQQTAEVTNEKIRYYNSESDLDSDLANISDDEVIFTQEGNDDRCGIPLGAKLAIQSNVVPYGYLPCNGVAFDENQYPALYTLLGDNHTPVEGHTLDWDNAESITISTTDYVIQKNGWLVGFGIPSADGEVSITVNDILVSRGGLWTGYYTDRCVIQIKVNKGDVVKSSSNFSTQNFHLVPYKYYKVIKATSGLTAEQQDYVLQSLLEADSYSTEEVATGKKWIDGKMIYRRAFYSATNWANDTIIGTIQNLDTVIRNDNYTVHNSGSGTDAWHSNYVNNSVSNYSTINASTGAIKVLRSAPFASSLPSVVIVEYTKAD